MVTAMSPIVRWREFHHGRRRLQAHKGFFRVRPVRPTKVSYRAHLGRTSGAPSQQAVALILTYLSIVQSTVQ